ncbi:MAG: FHA domain-containing protein [Alloprevotella sp.]
MNIGEEIIVGRMGQQAMPIADLTVDPEHALLRKTAEGTYQIEDKGSTKGIFVCGMRVKRKTINAQTPLFLGSFKTSVQQLLKDPTDVDLNAIWEAYDKEKRQWDRKNMLVNYLRVIPSILAMIIGMFLGQNYDNQTRVLLTLGLTVSILIISMILSDKIMNKRNVRMAELNADMQQNYKCPHCHQPLPLTPYKVLKAKRFCPKCNLPLP